MRHCSPHSAARLPKKSCDSARCRTVQRVLCAGLPKSAQGPTEGLQRNGRPTVKRSALFRRPAPSADSRRAPGRSQRLRKSVCAQGLRPSRRALLLVPKTAIFQFAIHLSPNVLTRRLSVGPIAPVCAVRGSPEERTGADRRSPKEQETFGRAVGGVGKPAPSAESDQSRRAILLRTRMRIFQFRMGLRPNVPACGCTPRLRFDAMPNCQKSIPPPRRGRAEQRLLHPAILPAQWPHFPVKIEEQASRIGRPLNLGNLGETMPGAAKHTSQSAGRANWLAYVPRLP